MLLHYPEINIPLRQIRAAYNDKTIRFYPPYSDAITHSALAQDTFVSPHLNYNE